MLDRPPRQLASLSLAALALAAPSARAQCELQRLEASDGGRQDGFGLALAFEGEELLVGAPSFPSFGGGSGAFYAFEPGPLGWTEKAKVEATDAAPGDRFGAAIALSGRFALIGAPNADATGPGSGAAYVVERTESGWVERQKIVGDDTGPGDGFGSPLALSGETALIQGAGFVYVFERGANGWTQTDLLAAPGGGPFAPVASVALSGRIAAVGVPTEAGPFVLSGAVHVFERGADGWHATARLSGPSISFQPPTGDPLGAGFGSSVALEDDLLAVGEPRKDLSTAPFSGAAHLYRRTDAGWEPLQELVPPPGPTGLLFGHVAVSEGRVLVGSNTGGAFLFEQRDSTWTAVAHLFVPSQGLSGAYLGLDERVALSGDTPVVAGKLVVELFVVEGTVSVFALASACPDPDDIQLQASPATLSLVDGGSQELALGAGAFYAHDAYLLLGSASGVAPGTAVDGVALPLNPDAYFSFTLLNPNQGFLQATAGRLDELGNAKGSLAFPPGLDLALTGLTLHHAYLVIRGVGEIALVLGSSNAVPLTFGDPQTLLAEDFESGAVGWTFDNTLLGQWHLAPDGECGASTTEAAYNAGPPACDYAGGVLGIHTGKLLSPAFTLAGQAPFDLVFRSAAALDGIGNDLMSIRLLDTQSSAVAVLAGNPELESGGLEQVVTLPLPPSWAGRSVQLAFAFAATGAGDDDTLGWRFDDVLVTAFAP